MRFEFLPRRKYTGYSEPHSILLLGYLMPTKSVLAKTINKMFRRENPMLAYVDKYTAIKN